MFSKRIPEIKCTNMLQPIMWHICAIHADRLRRVGGIVNIHEDGLFARKLVK